jgi:hypothetical protein
MYACLKKEVETALYLNNKHTLQLKYKNILGPSAKTFLFCDD